ncbi:MAG: hypothetical protein WA943_01005 [Parvibaculum sp.]|jgi:hypothetical protein|uniref:hypothetical protein n=1 Tax=Parvibaculum sp. TaxID=2024848 RepID=UPI003C727909
MKNSSDRSVKNIGKKALLGALAVSALLSGALVTPAFADRWDRGHHGRYERWEHRHYHRYAPVRGYWAPGYYPPPPVYYAPPPVYYAPPPPPVYYGVPSLNVVIPIR